MIKSRLELYALSLMTNAITTTLSLIKEEILIYASSYGVVHISVERHMLQAHVGLVHETPYIKVPYQTREGESGSQVDIL